MAIDWDINDSIVPKVNPVDLDPFNEWPDGHCRLVYTAVDEEVKKHASGWAMRNTNNHNVNILKKSCLGVLLCSLRCTPPIGNKIHIRPAICDKARKKQRGKACPNGACHGRLVIQACRGHCGYPVTHFWRKNGDEVYFQAKGTHDHPRPEPKGSNQTKQLFTKRKTSSVDLLKRKSAVNTKIRSLRLNSSMKKPSQPMSDALNFSYAGDYSIKNTVTGDNINSMATWSTDYQQFNDRVPDYQSHQDIPMSYGSASPASTYYAHQSPPVQHSPQSASDMFSLSATDDFIRPEDIFQLDQPIRQQAHSYAGSTYSNGMSPSSASRSPPATFLDMESGTIASTFHQYPATSFTQSLNPKSWTTNNGIKFESCDDATSLTSISQEFDENYFTFQQMQSTSTPAIETPTADTSYFPPTEYQFFDHCENVATGSSSVSETDASQFYSTSGFDADYEMLNSAVTATGNPMHYNEWSGVDLGAYGGNIDAPYTFNQPHYQYQQMNYLSA